MNKAPQSLTLGVPLDLFPGKSAEAKRLNASLIKRQNYHPKYAACYGLEGEPLKQELLKARAVLQGRTERGVANNKNRITAASLHPATL